MKIIQINKFFYRRGGADHHWFDLIALLESHGETVVPFSMRGPGNMPSPYDKYFVSNLELGRFNWRALWQVGRIFYSWEAKRKLGALLRAEKPEVAHVHLLYHHLSPSILVALKKAGIPVVATIHDWKFICPNYTLFTEGALCTRCKDKKYWHATRHRCLHGSWWQSVLASLEAYFHHARRYYEDYIDLYLAPSYFVKDMMVNFGWPAEKIIILPHWLPASLAGSAVLPAPSTPRFAYVGRLSPEKGVRELVAYWCQEAVPYRLDVYGAGPQFLELKELVAKNNNRQVRLCGEVAREKLWSELAGATATIVPSLAPETFGLSALESLARGVPVIAHRAGALIEMLETSQAGALFDWNGAGVSLKDALADVLAHPKYRLAAGNYIRTLDSPDEYYRKVVQIYRELLDREAERRLTIS